MTALLLAAKDREIWHKVVRLGKPPREKIGAAISAVMAIGLEPTRRRQ